VYAKRWGIRRDAFARPWHRCCEHRPKCASAEEIIEPVRHFDVM
jgi:hypothetical protein